MKRTKKKKIDLQRTTLTRLKELKRKELEQALGGDDYIPLSWFWCPGCGQGCY